MICPIAERECERFAKETNADQRSRLAQICLDASVETRDVQVYDCFAESTFITMATLFDAELGEL